MILNRTGVHLSPLNRFLSNSVSVTLSKFTILISPQDWELAGRPGSPFPIIKALLNDTIFAVDR